MELFSTKQKNDSATLAQESGSILSVFRQTIAKLSSVNERAEAEREAKLAEIEAAKVEAEQLKQLCEDNGNIIVNINNLLNN